MMEPRIQYAHTSDGVSIAFWTLGEGEPLVHTGVLFGHVQLEWQMPECRRWYERLARDRMLIRFDTRGMGLSDRVGALSGAAFGLDIGAVVDRLRLGRFALLAGDHSGPVAIGYAARYPERVSHLILWGTYARASDWSQSPSVQAVRALMEKDWTFYTEAAAHATLGWSEGEPARRFAALIRESITQEGLRRVIAVVKEFDVTHLLPEVKVPTLVLQRRRSGPGVDVARGLASGIPEARLVILEGESGAPYLGDTEAVLSVIDEFLGEGAERRSEEPPTPAVCTILFTDIEGSTALTQRLGDAKAREVLREHERIVREALKAHGGSEVKTMGDGFMASFGSATRALECAIAVQQAFAAQNEAVSVRPEPVEGRAASAEAELVEAGAPAAHGRPPLRIRIGLNAGEPIAEDDPDGRGDLFGTAVIRAARIAALAQGGEILVANVVRELAEGKGFLFGDRGEVALRGFDDPVRLFEVRWRPFDSPSAAATGGSG